MSVQQELSRRKDLGVKLENGASVNPVQIDAPAVGSVVSVDDSVGVEHRDELEDVFLPERNGSGVGFAQQKSEKSVHHETGLSLT